MNILFFLTPKSEVAYIHDDESLRQVLEKMEYHKYSAVPIISRQGTYVGTITEGDLLWYIKNQLDLNLQEARRILITNVPRRSDNTPVSIDSNMEDLLDKAMKQNFVPGERRRQPCADGLQHAASGCAAAFHRGSGGGNWYRGQGGC